ncbi:unnamed protein product, partial [Ectocarpus sp. 6 AP-2014]
MRHLPLVFCDEDRTAEAATVLAKLKSITHELESKELDEAAKKLQAYSDFLEQELRDLCERAAGRSPPEVALMRECSDILFALNEGDRLQSRFVFFVVTQEHDFIRAGGAADPDDDGTNNDNDNDNGSDSDEDSQGSDAVARRV